MTDNHEKRRFIRQKFPYTIFISLPDKKEISTYTEDISEGGVKVIIKDKLNISSAVGLKIYIEKDPLICQGKIRWSMKKINEIIDDKATIFYDTGIEFGEMQKKDRIILKQCVEELKTHGKYNLSIERTDN